MGNRSIFSFGSEALHRGPAVATAAPFSVVLAEAKPQRWGTQNIVTSLVCSSFVCSTQTLVWWSRQDLLQLNMGRSISQHQVFTSGLLWFLSWMNDAGEHFQELTGEELLGLSRSREFFKPLKFFSWLKPKIFSWHCSTSSSLPISLSNTTSLVVMGTDGPCFEVEEGDWRDVHFGAWGLTGKMILPYFGDGEIGFLVLG